MRPVVAASFSNPVGDASHPIELLPYLDQDSDLSTYDNDGGQSFEIEEDVEVALLTPQSQRPKPTRNALVASIERTCYALATWVIGPQPPRLYAMQPVFGDVQSAPPRLLKRYCSKDMRFCLLLTTYTIWAVLFVATLGSSVFGCQTADYGSPVRLSCVSRFWPGTTICGLNGQNCGPFSNRTFAFRCPGSCKDTIISTPEFVGDREINYRNVVVGGSREANSTSIPVYRGDSFICGAAIHAGLIDDRSAGVGIISLVGEQRKFPSVQSNGILSIEFDSSFPVAFTFPEGGRAMESSKGFCRDPRWILLAISVIFSSLLSTFTTSPAVFFGSVFVGVYFSVALALDPAEFEDYYSVISWALGKFLPAAFVGFVIYSFCVAYTLRGLTAQFEKTILWLGACWVGALNNFTFDRLPIQRLTPHDLTQPGAISTLVVLVTLIFAIALGQAWVLRNEGRLLRYLKFYIIVGLVLSALIVVPHMNLRLHHYILALLLLPGTTLQTRPSLVYQGLLVGLFINGVARWGFDSILQTPAELFGSDFRGVVPHIPPPVIDGTKITFSWTNITAPFDGVSILVNDVERFGSYADNALRSFTFARYKTDEAAYFRFGYVRYLKMGGSSIGDYTKPGRWAVNGSWFQ